MIEIIIGGLSFLFCLWLVTHIHTAKRLNKTFFWKNKYANEINSEINKHGGKNGKI